MFILSLRNEYIQFFSLYYRFINDATVLSVILMLVDLRVYLLVFIYVNSITYKLLFIVLYPSHFQSNKMTFLNYYYVKGTKNNSFDLERGKQVILRERIWPISSRCNSVSV